MFGKNGKLVLKRETLRTLSDRKMQDVVGGRMLNSGASHGCTCTCKCEPTIVCSLVGCVKAGFAY